MQKRKRKYKRRSRGLSGTAPRIIMMESNSSNLKWKIIGIAMAGLAIGGGIYFGRKWIKKLKQAKAEGKSLSEGDPANFATRLKMAFDNDNYFGWGTNTEQVFKVFSEIPSKSFYKKVQSAYKDSTGGHELNHDLQDELSLKEYLKVQSIMSAKPEKSKT